MEAFESSDNQEVNNNNLELDDTVPEDDYLPEEISRYKNLQFKKAVKSRGWPKRKVKQVTFNKTALDKRPVNKRPRTVK